MKGGDNDISIDTTYDNGISTKWYQHHVISNTGRGRIGQGRSDTAEASSSKRKCNNNNNHEGRIALLVSS